MCRQACLILKESYACYTVTVISLISCISCLEAVTFFRVSKLTHRRPERQCNLARDRNPAISKLTHRRPERQCNLARDRNPAKGKPLLRQGTDGNRSLEGDISLNSLTEAPIVFSAFAVGETASPLSAA